MAEPAHPMLIRSLASNYLKRTLRSPFGTWILGGSLLTVLCFWAPVFLYAFYAGFSAVRFLDIDRSVNLLAGVNPAILPVLIAWGLFEGLFLRRKIYVSDLYPVYGRVWLWVRWAWRVCVSSHG